MKKFLFFAAAAALMVSCSGGNTEVNDQTVQEAQQEDTVPSASVKEGWFHQQNTQAAPAQPAANPEYGEWLDQMTAAANKLESYGKKVKKGGNYPDWDRQLYPVVSKYDKYEKKLKKVKKELTPDQRAQYNAAKKKFDNNIGWFVG